MVGGHGGSGSGGSGSDGRGSGGRGSGGGVGGCRNLIDDGGVRIGQVYNRTL